MKSSTSSLIKPTSYLLLVVGLLLFSGAAEARAQSMDAAALSNAFANASEQCKRSVVSINVGLSRTTQKRLKHLEEYLQRMGEDVDRDALPGGGVGSGVIVSEDGYILTNHHVIDDVDEDSILITMHDGRRYFADVIGSDPSSDLALIRIYADDLSPARFADPSSVRLGELVLAIGSPLGLKFTVTSGVISAMNRDDWDDEDYSVKRFIQTDAAINPGNSGGGLFRVQGDLVGINTAILSRTGFNIGYGLAITTDLFIAVYKDLKEDGMISRPSLGVSARSESFDSSLVFDRPRVEETVIIDKIKPGGAADAGGIKVGDIVRTINGVQVKRKENIIQHMALYDPGQTIAVGIGRGTDTLNVSVKLDSMDIPFKQKPRSVTRKAYLGASVDERDGACYLKSVRRYGPTEHAGLQDGDKVVSLNGKPIARKSDIEGALGALQPGQEIEAIIDRAGRSMNTTIIVGASHAK